MDELIRTQSHDGIVARKDLLSAGATRSQMSDAQADGRITRLTRSLFATADADPGVVTAVSAGGSLTCLSALERLGVWTLDVGAHHHIRRPERRRRDGHVPDAIECRSLLAHRRRYVDSLDAALVAVVLNHSSEDAIVVLDCVLHQQLRTRAELEKLFAEAPKYAVETLAQASGLSESALESVTRFRLARRNVRVRQQVHISGVGRFDLLIGRRILVELDGFEHHRSRKQFREDRRRDRRALELGYIVLRFTWEDVMHDWPRMLREILAYVQRDFHRLPPRRLAGSDVDPTRRPESTARWPATPDAFPVGVSGHGEVDVDVAS